MNAEDYLKLNVDFVIKPLMSYDWNSFSRILVCGGRDFAFHYHSSAPSRLKFRSFVEDSFLRSALTLVTNEYRCFLCRENVLIIHGGADGADLAADNWAVTNWVPMEEYRASWKEHGHLAGPLRNQKMLDEGKPDLVVAFPGGKGTADMCARAVRAKLPLLRFYRSDQDELLFKYKFTGIEEEV